MHQFACPHCGARLRLKDKSFAGRTVNCPDCHRPVAIRVGNGGELVGEAAAAPAGAALPVEPGSRRRLAISIAVGVLAALVVAGAFFVFRSGDSSVPPLVENPPAEAKQDAPPPEQPAEPQPAADAVATRLTSLGQQIDSYVKEQGVFPAPPPQPRLPPEQRLSWMAALVSATGAGEVRPEAERGWADPLNDPFVRRTSESFQNPAIAPSTGPAGHPVSQFAGIAGVGAEAPSLPVDHPRAGIFGLERTTRVEDVRDGQSNTLMVAGVRNQLDSWAANGPATIRPLSAEPYFGGPDGLGTGEQGGMSVLMADGSVRFLSSDTDPRLMRRMAAMADGLPLDAAVPGEPGEATPAPRPVAIVSPVEPAPAEGPETKPIDVALAPDPVFDLEAALDQPIAAFEQQTPHKISELLKLVGEMAGVPIDTSQLDGTARERLDRTTSLSLQDTTVRGVLDASVEKAGLTYSLGEGVVVLIAAEEAR